MFLTTNPGGDDHCRSGGVFMKGEPPLNEYLLAKYPLPGDFVVVQGEVSMGLADGLHELVITKISDGYSLFDCSTQDGEKDNIQIDPSEIIDWRKNP